MNKKDSIQSITNDLRTILLKAKKEIKQKNDKLKNTKNVHQLTKKEYQALYNEHAQLKKSSLNMKNTLSLLRSKEKEMRGKS